MRSLVKNLSILVTTFLIKDTLAQKGFPTTTSTAWQNCTYNETSYSETWDTPEWNKTRWSLNYGGFGWSAGHGFKTVNEWTVIPGVGNYTNLERGA